MQPPIDGGTILVTGASSGIGAELARQLAPRAGRIILSARRADRLEALAAELRGNHPDLGVDIHPCDLTDSEAVENLAATVGPIDIFVNNAGVGDNALFDRADWLRLERMIATNVVASTLLTRRLVPGMVERGRGGILTIGSGAGIALMPLAAVYVGTKNFVHGFTEALALDLAGTGVAVTEVCPGPVETEFDDHAGMDETGGGLPPFFKISAEQCAREAIAGFEKGKQVVFPGTAYRILMTVFPLMPRALMRAPMRRAAMAARSR